MIEFCKKHISTSLSTSLCSAGNMKMMTTLWTFSEYNNQPTLAECTSLAASQRLHSHFNLGRINAKYRALDERKFN